MIRLLLEIRMVDVDLKAFYGCTPSFGVALGGHDGVVKLLLEKDKVPSHQVKTSQRDEH